MQRWLPQFWWLRWWWWWWWWWWCGKETGHFHLLTTLSNLETTSKAPKLSDLVLLVSKVELSSQYVILPTNLVEGLKSLVIEFKFLVGNGHKSLLPWSFKRGSSVWPEKLNRLPHLPKLCKFIVFAFKQRPIDLLSSVKNDRRSSGGTLRQKFNFIDLWHLTFYIWFLTFYIWHFTYDIWHLTFNQWTKKRRDQWTNVPMDQRTNGPMGSRTLIP